MDATPVESILVDLRIAYCLTDRSLNIIQVGGCARILPGPQVIEYD